MEKESYWNRLIWNWHKDLFNMIYRLALYVLLFGRVWRVLTNALSCDSEHQLLQHQRQSRCSSPHTHHQCFSAGHTSREAVLQEKEKEFPLVETNASHRLVPRRSTRVRQNNGQIQMLKENLSRGEMILLPQSQLLKQRGVSLYSTVAKVAQWRDYYKSVGVSPFYYGLIKWYNVYL